MLSDDTSSSTMQSLISDSMSFKANDRFGRFDSIEWPSYDPIQRKYMIIGNDISLFIINIIFVLMIQFVICLHKIIHYNQLLSFIFMESVLTFYPSFLNLIIL